MLASNNGVDAAQIYLRLALFLNPASDIAKLELAELYGNLEQYDKAIAVIDAIHDGSAFSGNAKVRKALYLNALQKTDDAVALLKAVLDKNPKEDQVVQTLASIESARKNYEAAIPYYDRAIELAGPPRRSIGASITRAGSPMSARSNGRRPSRTSRRRWNSIPSRALC